ncbi:MAG: DNA repair protein RecO [Verrucomicrobiales bacterium]|nr:DNA repair protein RecO [Verrucomicrobiota bacterium JB025]
MESTRAIITRLTRLTDTSLIAHWFTEDHGLVKTVARGARRPNSPFAGKIDLFFAGTMTCQRAKKGDLHSLREFSVSSWREGLRRDYTSTLLAGYCCQLLENSVEPEHPEPELFDLLRRALDHIDTEKPTFRALRHFEKELVRILGVTHQEWSPERSLRHALGSLPASRDDLIERLHQV